jgi:apolipoprotein N-acyltransferase
VFVTALLACQVNVGYFKLIFSLPAAALVVCLQATLWLFIAGQSARVVRRASSPWSLLAYPVMWVAADTLQAKLLPEGNWGSLAFSQASFLPIMQSASLFGVSGILFLLCLPASAMALAITKRMYRGSIFAFAILAPLAAVAWGSYRLGSASEGGAIPVGVASIDDAIGADAKAPYVEGIRDAYEDLVRDVAGRSARLVLLPEKIAVSAESKSNQWDLYFSRLARQSGAWLLARLATQQASAIVNEAWL